MADEINCAAALRSGELPATYPEMCEDGQDPFLIAGKSYQGRALPRQRPAGKRISSDNLIPNHILMRGFPGKRKACRGALKAMRSRQPLVLVHSAQQPGKVQATRRRDRSDTHEEIGKRIYPGCLCRRVILPGGSYGDRLPRKLVVAGEYLGSCSERKPRWKWQIKGKSAGKNGIPTLFGKNKSGRNVSG